MRLAIGDAGRAKLAEEGDRYAGIPAYAANFERMGVKPVETAIAVSTPMQSPAALAPWRGAVDEVVLRAITAGRRSRRTSCCCARPSLDLTGDHAAICPRSGHMAGSASQGSPSRPDTPAETLVAVACVSAALLMTELALTRIFSVVMYYHFAFLAISVALFGLSASGVFAFCADGSSRAWKPGRCWRPDRWSMRPARSSRSSCWSVCASDSTIRRETSR